VKEGSFLLSGREGTNDGENANPFDQAYWDRGENDRKGQPGCPRYFSFIGSGESNGKGMRVIRAAFSTPVQG